MPDQAHSDKLASWISAILPTTGKCGPLDLVARRTVVYPFTGDKRCTVESAEKIVKQWRNFMKAMYATGMPACMQKKWIYFSCVNCRPCGYITETKTKVCRVEHLCPFCYGRKSQGVFIAALKACRQLPEYLRSAYSMYGIRITQRLEINESIKREFKSALADGLEWRQKLYKQLDPAGGYLSMTLSPLSVKNMWSCCYRAVLLGPKESIPDKTSLPVKSWLGSVQVRDGVKPYSLARLVARTLSYPKGTLFSDPRRVKKWLDARVRCRLSATYGLFRYKSPDQEEAARAAGKETEDAESQAITSCEC